MNRVSQTIAILALALITTTASAAGKKVHPVQRMSSGSTDGDKTYYTVWCINKTIGSVIAEHDTQQFCALAKGGKRTCDKRWNLKKASVHACKAPQ